MLEGAFALEQFDPMVDNLLGGWVPQDMITALKTWMEARRASVVVATAVDLCGECGLAGVRRSLHHHLADCDDHRSGQCH